jgi:hypothetical protein
MLKIGDVIQLPDKNDGIVEYFKVIDITEKYVILDSMKLEFSNCGWCNNLRSKKEAYIAFELADIENKKTLTEKQIKKLEKIIKESEE